MPRNGRGLGGPVGRIWATLCSASRRLWTPVADVVADAWTDVHRWARHNRRLRHLSRLAGDGMGRHWRRGCRSTAGPWGAALGGGGDGSRSTVGRRAVVRGVGGGGPADPGGGGLLPRDRRAGDTPGHRTPGGARTRARRSGHPRPTVHKRWLLRWPPRRGTPRTVPQPPRPRPRPGRRRRKPSRGRRPRRRPSTRDTPAPPAGSHSRHPTPAPPRGSHTGSAMPARMLAPMPAPTPARMPAPTPAPTPAGPGADRAPAPPPTERPGPTPPPRAAVPAPTSRSSPRAGHCPSVGAMRILITGAGRAIGATTATVLTRAGHEVVATGRDARSSWTTSTWRSGCNST